VRYAASGDRSPGIVVCAGLCRVAGRSVFLLPGLWGGLPPCPLWAGAPLLQGPTREARAAPISRGCCDVLRECRGCARTCKGALRRGNDPGGNARRALIGGGGRSWHRRPTAPIASWPVT